MLQILKSGVSGVLVPLVLWTVVFTLVTLIIGIVMTVKVRRRLKRSGRKTGALTGIMLTTHLLLLPGMAAYTGVSFSLPRSVANLVEDKGRETTVWLVGQGMMEVMAGLGVDSKDELVDLSRLKKYLGEQAMAGDGSSGGGINPAARIGHPIALLFTLPFFIKGMSRYFFFHGLKALVSKTEKSLQGITWAQLSEKVAGEAGKLGDKYLRQWTSHLRTGALLGLLTLLGVIVLVNMLFLMISRQRKEQEKPNEESPAT